MYEACGVANGDAHCPDAAVTAAKPEPSLNAGIPLADAAPPSTCRSDSAIDFTPMQAYEISSDPAKLDVKAIHSFLAAAYWSPGIPLETVERAVRNSVCIGAYLGMRQVGFARTVTDKATFAYLADVYVLEQHRGNGLSKRMLEALLQLDELQGLRRMMLATRDAHALYEQFGFKPLTAPARFMERHNPNVYSTNSSSAAQPPRSGVTMHTNFRGSRDGTD